LFKASKSLLAFDFAAKDVVPILGRLGDVSAGSGKDISELAIIFGKIKSAGKLQGQELNQLIDAGFNPLNDIAKKTGKTMSQLKKEMAAGNITFAMVDESFIAATSSGGKFFNLMQKQSGSLNGKLSTLKDALQQIGENLGSIALPALSAITDKLNSAADSLKNVTAGKGTVGEKAAVGAVAGGVGAAGIAGAALIGPTVANLVQSAFSKVKFSSIIAAMLKTGGNGLKIFGVQMSLVTAAARKGIIPLIQTVGAFNVLRSALTLAATSIKSFAVSSIGLMRSGLASIATSMGFATKGSFGLSTSLSWLSTAMNSGLNSIGRFATAIWTGFITAMKAGWASTVKFATAMWTGFIPAMKAGWASTVKFATAIWTGFIPAMQAGWASIAKFATAMWTGFIPAMNAGWARLVLFGKTLGTLGVSGTITAGWGLLNTAVVTASTAISTTFASLFAGLTSSAAVAGAAVLALVAELYLVAKGFSDTSESAKEWGTEMGVLDMIGASFKNIGSTIKELALEIPLLGSVFKAVGGAYDATASKLGEWGNSIAKTFSSVMDSISGAVTQMSVDIVNTLTSGQFDDLFRIDEIFIAADPLSKRRADQLAARKAKEQQAAADVELEATGGIPIDKSITGTLKAQMIKSINILRQAGHDKLVAEQDAEREKGRSLKAQLKKSIDILKQAGHDKIVAEQDAEREKRKALMNSIKNVNIFKNKPIEFGDAILNSLPDFLKNNPLIKGQVQQAKKLIAGAPERETRLAGAFGKGSVEANRILTQLEPEDKKQDQVADNTKLMATLLKKMLDGGVNINNVAVAQ